MINKTHLTKPKEFFKYDIQLIVVIGLLCCFGLAFLASSLNLNDESEYWGDLQKQFIIGILGGGIIATILALTDYHIWTRNKDLIAKVSFGLLGFVGFFAFLTFFIPSADAKNSFINEGFVRLLPIKPHIANGSVRWIDFPFGLPNIQPSEVAKITTLIYFAGFFGKNYREGFSWEKIKLPLWMFGTTALLILLQPDLGTIAIIFVIIFSAMTVAKVPTKMLRQILIFGSLIGLLSIVFTPYRLTRVLGIINTDGDTKIEQVVNIQKAINRGGLWGKGYGASMKRQANIYEVSTDSIIAVIGEEIGFVGTTAFLMLYVWLFYRGMKIAHEAVDLEGKMIATGIVVWIASQVFLNVCGMTGMIPMKGLPLPFVSKGGTAIVITLIAMGILLNISSQKRSEFR